MPQNAASLDKYILNYFETSFKFFLNSYFKDIKSYIAFKSALKNYAN